MDWPHSPVHRFPDRGACMVTAGTYLKQQCFNTPQRLDLVCDWLFKLAEKYNWNLQAWAILSNHYHFVALTPEKPDSLPAFVQHLHSTTAIAVNRMDGTPGRKVWFQYWDTRLSDQKAYFARLSYVHQNAVHHRLVAVPSAYRWCSAAWFERCADPAFYRTVMNFPCTRIHVPDGYD